MTPATRLRLFYFAYYGGVGTFLPFFAPYLRGLGFTGEQIGTVQMIGPLVAVPTTLAWATAADRLRAPARALALATAWAFLAVLLLPAARTPVAVGLVLLAYSLADRAVVPLVDSLTVEWTVHNPEASYARIRLFGSVGFAVLTSSVGLLLTWRGDRPGDVLVPVAVATCVGGYALVARRLPIPPVPSHPPRFREMAGLLRDGPFLALLAVFSLHWGATAPFHLLFGLFVRDLGLPASVTGVAMTVGVAAEVVALLAFPRVAALFSLRAILGRLLRGERAALAAPVAGRGGRRGWSRSSSCTPSPSVSSGARPWTPCRGPSPRGCGPPGRPSSPRWSSASGTRWATSSPAWATTAGTAWGRSSPGRGASSSLALGALLAAAPVAAHVRSRSVFAPIDWRRTRNSSAVDTASMSASWAW